MKKISTHKFSVAWFVVIMLVLISMLWILNVGMSYYPFVWFFATALAIALSADMDGIRLYAVSLVTALATGFAGDRLAGNIMNSKP